MFVLCTIDVLICLKVHRSSYRRPQGATPARSAVTNVPHGWRRGGNGRLGRIVGVQEQ